MATFEITAPDGRVFVVEGEGTAEEALASFKRQLAAQDAAEFQDIGSEVQAVTEVLDDFAEAGLNLPGQREAGAFLMNLAAASNDTLKGIRQLAATPQEERITFPFPRVFNEQRQFDPGFDQVNLNPFTITPGREEDVLQALAEARETEKLATEVSEQEPIAGPAGTVTGFVAADPVNIAGAGLAFKGAVTGAKMLGAAPKLARSIAGATSGAFTGSTAYIDPEAGITREELTGLTTVGGLVLTPLIETGVQRYLKWKGNNALKVKSNMVDDYANLYSANLVALRGNKQAAHAATKKKLGYNWGATRQLAEEAERGVPTLPKNPQEAVDVLRQTPQMRDISDPNLIRQLDAGDLSPDEAQLWAKSLTGRIGKDRKLSEKQLKQLRNAKKQGNIDKALGALSTRIKNIDPRTHAIMRRFEFDISNFRNKWIKRTKPFFSAMDDLATRMDPRDYQRLIGKLYTNTDDFEAAVLATPGGKRVAKEFPEIRKLLDEVYDLGGDIEGVIGKRLGFFPRKLSYDPAKAQLVIGDQRLKNIRDSLTRQGLDPDDPNNWDKALNEYVQRQDDLEFAKGASGLSRTRKLEFVTTDQVPAYLSPRGSMEKYLNDAAHLVARRQMFQRLGAPDDMVKATGEVLDPKKLSEIFEARGLLPEDARAMSEMLTARLGPGEQQMGRNLGMLKDTSHIFLLGDFISTLTQAQDIYASMYKNGVFNALRGGFRNFTGKGLSKQEVLGLVDITADMASEARLSKRVSDKVLQSTGFRSLDKFGKQTFMNSSVLKNQKLAKDPEKFFEKWGVMFGDNTEQLRVDLLNFKKASDVTEDMALMLWDDLSNVQPISLLEMPQRFLEMPNGRFLYTLQSFTLKQLDILRNDVWNSIKTGDKAGATANLLAYASFFTGSSVGVDAMKNHLRGEDINVMGYDGLLVEGALKAIGMNKYTLDKFNRDPDIMGYIANQVGAGFALPNILLTGASEVAKGKPPYELLELVPGIGRTLKNRLKATTEDESLFGGDKDTLFGEQGDKLF